MAGKLEFRAKLSGVLELAKSKGGKIALEDVEKYFEDDQLSQEQMDLVCEYLMSQKMVVLGYVKKGGTIKEKKEEPVAVSKEEQAYIEDYLRYIAQLRDNNMEEVRMAYYLPKVIEEAIKMHHPDIFIGDMIQEGSISLMLALNATGEGKEDEAKVMEEVRAGIQTLIESQTETKRQDKKMVERVSELEETIQNMKEEFGREVSAEEVAERLGVTEEELGDILKLAGEDS